jgi:nitrous oxidase accessory protein NosD
MLPLPARAVLAAALCSANAIAFAANLRVPEEFPTIQAAIHAARHGDTVLVAPGTYLENLKISRSVTLRSSAGAESTVIDGGGTGPVIIARGTGGERVTISGFTITNGLSTVDHLTADPSSSSAGINAESMVVTIRYNIIHHNVGCIGSGIDSSSAAVTIEANQIIDNAQHPTCDGANGGGVSLRTDGSEPSVVAGNVIARNRVGGYGGGIAAHNTRRLTVRDNLISGNHAPSGYGGGMVLLDGSATVSRNAFAGNSAASGGAMALFPLERALVEGNLMSANSATTDGSAITFVTAEQQQLRLADNVADGDSIFELIQCGMPGYVVPADNLLRNPSGPLLGNFCATP